MIQSNTFRRTFHTVGGETSFSTGIVVQASSELKVYYHADRTSTTDPVLWVLGTDYTLSNVGSSLGVTVNNVTSVVNGGALYVFREGSKTQLSDFVRNVTPDSDVLETSLDKLALAVQEMQGKLEMCLHMPWQDYPEATNGSPPVNNLPTTNNRKNKLVGFGTTGTTELYTVDVDDLTLVPPNSVATGDIQNEAVTAEKLAATLDLSTKTITLANATLATFINGLTSQTSPEPADSFLIRANTGGTAKKLTLLNLINGLSAEATPAAAMKLLVTDGTNVRTVSLATLISGLAASLTTPAGTELLQANDAGTLKKILFSDLRKYCADVPYIKFAGVRAAGTSDGTSSAASWNTRFLNTEVHDTASLVTAPSSNQFTLPTGTYYVMISAPTVAVTKTISRLYSVSGSATVMTGSTSYSFQGYGMSHSTISGRLTVSGSPTTYKIETYTEVSSADNLGYAANAGVDETYTTAEFWKLA